MISILLSSSSTSPRPRAALVFCDKGSPPSRPSVSGTAIRPFRVDRREGGSLASRNNRSLVCRFSALCVTVKLKLRSGSSLTGWENFLQILHIFRVKRIPEKAPTRLSHLINRVCENFVHKSIAPHLRRLKICNICKKNSPNLSMMSLSVALI